MISEEDIKFPDIPFIKTAALILVGLVLYLGYLYIVGFEEPEGGAPGRRLQAIAVCCRRIAGGNITAHRRWLVGFSQGHEI